MSVFRAATVLLALSGAAVAATCDESTLNTTTSTYKVLANDTIFSIAEAVNRTACEIARYNRMADAELVYAGQGLVIPGESCPGTHNDTCLLQKFDTIATCINGGPHVYETILGDTVSRIANYKLGITTDSFLATIQDHYPEVLTVDTVIPAGATFKVPQCSPSQLTLIPFEFTYGTYQDLAYQYNCTTGHIFAFNHSYNFSTSAQGTGPVITLPTNCKALSDNITTIS